MYNDQNKTEKDLTSIDKRFILEKEMLMFSQKYWETNVIFATIYQKKSPVRHLKYKKVFILIP